jgi:hypothetical protein
LNVIAILDLQPSFACSHLQIYEGRGGGILEQSRQRKMAILQVFLFLSASRAALLLLLLS